MSRYVLQFKAAGDHCYSTMCCQFNIFEEDNSVENLSAYLVKLKHILKLQVELLIKRK